MQKRVLLAGTSYSAAPIYFRLKAHGQQVAVCGALPDDPCHAYADQSFSFDYSKRDLLLDVVRKEKFDFLCPSCNDYSYLSCAWVAEQCGLPGYDSYDTTAILHHKGNFRRFLEKNGLPAPRVLDVSDVPDASHTSLPFPVLVKPVDSFSGRGMTKVAQATEISDALDAAADSSLTRHAVLEEFVEGSLHSHSAFIRHGRFAFDVFVDEFCTVYPYQVNCSNAPTSLSESVQASVRECMLELVSLLDLNDGLLHTQFIANGEDFWLIECMRRCPGDLYYRLVELSTGIDGHDLFVQPFISQDLPASIEPVRSSYCARHTISVPDSTAVFSFSHSIPSNDIQVVPLKTSGMVLGPAPYDKFAIVFAGFSSMEALVRHTPHLAEYINLQPVGRV